MQKIQAHDFTQVDYRLSVPYTPDASFGSFLRIVYFLHLNAGPESGVFKKVVTQVNQWRHLGNDVRVFLVTRYPAVRDALISFGLVKSNDVELYPEKRLTGLASRFRAFNALA